MKIKLAAILLSGVLSIPALALADCHLKVGGVPTGNTFYGPTVCSGKIAAPITVNGPLTLEDATIATLNVNGPLEGRNSTVANLTVNGTVKLDNTTVKELSLNGMLTATKSAIASVEAHGNLRFADSNVGNIVMKKDAAAQQHTVYLCGNTNVGGDITFAGNNGVIYMETKAKIVGKVSGADIHTVAGCNLE